MRLFVTGLGGYLGHALAVAAPAEVAGTVRDRAAPGGTRSFPVDVRDETAVAAAIAAFAPDAVVHAAYVQGGEQEWSTNVDGSAAVARAARAAGVRLVHLSSDTIFSGDLGRPVREDDPPAPVSSYGESKAAAEDAVSAADPAAVIVRTSLIYGGRELSKYELAALDPQATFYADEVRCPIAAADLAAALIELAGLSGVSGPLHVAGADAVSRLDLARLVAAVHGRDPAAVRGAARPPGRPGDVRLDCSRAQALLGARLRGAREVLRPGGRGE